MHDEHVFLAALEAVVRQAEEPRELADGGKLAGLDALELHTEHVQDVHLADDRVQVVYHLGAQRLEAARQERRRADEDDLGAQLGQAPQIGAGDAAVGDVADDGDLEPCDLLESFTDGVQVQQALRGMLVGAVAGIDDRAGDMAGQQTGSAGGGVAQDDDVDAHRLDVAGGVDEGLALVDAAVLFREVDDVGRQSLGGQAEARAGAGGILEKRVHDHAAAEGGDFFDAAGGDFLEGIGRVEDETDFLGRQFLQPQQMLARPVMCWLVRHVET